MVGISGGRGRETFRSIMREASEHIVFVDPKYFAGGGGQDFSWALFLGHTLGRVVANQLFNQTERQGQTGLAGTEREEIIEAFARHRSCSSNI